MCFQKPPMMWLFETHVASQRLPLRKLKLSRAGQLLLSALASADSLSSLSEAALP